MILSGILSSDGAHQLGWVLLHSAWQGGLLASALALALGALRDRSANLRYWTAYAGLVLMLVLPMATYCVVSERAEVGAQAPEVSSDNVPARPGNFAFSSGVSLDDIAAVDKRLGNRNYDRDYRDLPATTPLPWEVAVETIVRSTQRLQPTLSSCTPWLTTAWFVGALSLSLWHLGGWFTVQRLKYSGIPGEIEPLRCHLGSLSRRMKVARPVRLLQSAVVDVPAVVGWLRPVILLPATMVTGLSPSQLTAVLAHIRRHDYLFNLLQTVIETLLFYHPVAWWISRRIRAEREHCCDDLAVAACGSRIEYAEVLAALEEARSAPALALAAGGRRGDGLTLRRVRRILAGPSGNHTGPGAWLGGVLTIVLITSVSTVVALSLTTGSVEADRELNEAAASLPEVSLPIVTLTGRLIAGGEKPAGKCVVTLSAPNGTRRQEIVDVNQRYEFAHTPTGTYQLTCTPVDVEQPLLVISDLAVEAGRTRVQDLSFSEEFVLAGRIVGEDGRPLASIPVSIACREMNTRTEFRNATETDANGRYRLGSPLGVLSSLEVAGQPVDDFQPYLMPGENTADYVKGKTITPAENSEHSHAVPFYEGETEMRRFFQSMVMAAAASGFVAGSAEAQTPGSGGFGTSGGSGGGGSYVSGGAPDSFFRLIGYEEVRQDLELEDQT